jgi:hypothetical protein
MPQAVRTVNLTIVVSMISLCIALFTLFWSVRPARVEPVMSTVFVSREGGMHLSVPLSIANNGARPSAVLAAKLYESSGGRESIWNADFTADTNRAIPAMTGSITSDNASMWVPFAVPANGQVERVFIFRPVADTPDELIGSGRKVSYRVVLLLPNSVEVETGANVTWPNLTDTVLKQGRGGVFSMGSELDRWLTQHSR